MRRSNKSITQSLKKYIPFQLNIFDFLKPTTPKGKKTQRNVTPKSDANLFEIWQQLHQQYFTEHRELLEYKVKWSSRSQKRVLASCNIKRKVVSVALEFKEPTASVWLEPLLYHEMCHAVLDPEQLKRNGKIRWHGKEFRELETRHPRIKQLDHWMKEGGWRALRRKRKP